LLIINGEVAYKRITSANFVKSWNIEEYLYKAVCKSNNTNGTKTWVGQNREGMGWEGKGRVRFLTERKWCH
jgi:hypothetical protein